MVVDRMVRRALTAALAALILFLGQSVSAREAAPTDTFATLVDAQGRIRFPPDFPADFVYIGAWAVAGGNGVADIHAVYARPSDVRHFRQSGAFPDGAVLIKEVTTTIGAPHTTGRAYWPDKPVTWFMMVKDVRTRFPGSPLWGDGWGWAQFDPADKTRQIAKNYKADCLGCHVPARANDLVYTYAYPALGPRAQANVPAKAAPAVQEGSGHRETRQVINVSAMPAATSPVADEVATAKGKLAFESSCIGCHSVSSGVQGTGPSLFGVAGRKAGSLPGYEFSPAMKSSDLSWTAENLDNHLKNTRNFIPDNRMGRFFPGVPDAQVRADIIKYLSTLH
ncbi:MAG: c-type cytochrome [Flavobacteriales bacterium]|jgi:cytochrome c|nr:MAG: c-type cytochrome [Flavobacteriales bacterium]